jgi:hypothetical protein
MSNLPADQNQSTSPNQTVPVNVAPPQTILSGMNKEVEGIGLSSREFPPYHEIQTEMELRPEVAAAGVKVQPTTVLMPTVVMQSGVTAVGQVNPTQPPATIVLPISDDVIAEGLKQGVDSSWRWLAEWCVRKLKAIHQSIQVIHGHVTRVLIK